MHVVVYGLVSCMQQGMYENCTRATGLSVYKKTHKAVSTLSYNVSSSQKINSSNLEWRQLEPSIAIVKSTNVEKWKQ